MKTIRSILIMLVVILLSIPSSYAGKPIEDLTPLNFVGPSTSIQWEHREVGSWSYTKIPDTTKSGHFMTGFTQIKLEGYLVSYDDILSLTVSNTNEPELEYSLGMDPMLYETSNRNYYWFSRAEGWMWSGDWIFRLMYKGSDGFHHRQEFLYKGRPTQSFPPAPEHISVERASGGFLVTWQGIGEPWMWPDGRWGLNYYVRIYSNFGVEGSKSQRLYGTWQRSGATYTGIYDKVLNRVTFLIPYTWTFWDGETIETEWKNIRLESNVGNARGSRMLLLPYR